MNLPREWTLFLGLVDDLLNECECRMSSQDYSACESLLTRLHSTRNVCKRVACTLDVTAQNPRELETISKSKFLSDTLQGVIDCFEKKLYEIDMSSYVSSWLPESLVLRTSWKTAIGSESCTSGISWTRIAFILCISRSYAMKTS